MGYRCGLGRTATVRSRSTRSYPPPKRSPLIPIGQTWSWHRSRVLRARRRTWSNAPASDGAAGSSSRALRAVWGQPRSSLRFVVALTWWLSPVHRSMHRCVISASPTSSIGTPTSSSARGPARRRRHRQRRWSRIQFGARSARLRRHLCHIRSDRGADRRAGPAPPLPSRHPPRRHNVLGRRCVSQVISAIEHDELRPLVAETFPLDQIADAQRAFQRPGRFGNIVLTVRHHHP